MSGHTFEVRGDERRIEYRSAEGWRRVYYPGDDISELPDDVREAADSEWTSEVIKEVRDAAAAREAEEAARRAAERRSVLKSTIISRLHAAGKLEAAQVAINSDAYVRERWYAPDKPAIYADDAEAIALLEAIDADPDAILAP